MVQVSLQRGKRFAAALWHDILRYTVRLGHGGMSDEDDGEQSVQRGSRTNTERVRIIQLLPFRHPFFALLFEAVDRTPILDPDAFKQTGKTPLTRVRDGKVLCTRKPPKDLPRSFFPSGYLESLFPHERDELEVYNGNEWPLFEWNINGTRYRTTPMQWTLVDRNFHDFTFPIITLQFNTALSYLDSDIS